VADLFDEDPTRKKLLEELCVVYVLYFDEVLGHMPLVIYPIEGDKLKDNKKFMRPIKYHPIWFLDVEEQSALDHIDLDFKNFIFFGKKFLMKSEREKKRMGLQADTPEVVVVIVSLPKEIDMFGDDLIREMTEEIQNKFENHLYKIINAENAKKEIIQTKKTKDAIKEGNMIKDNLYNVIEKISNDYFSRVIKTVDGSSIRQQKAISYLSLKGIDVSSIGENIVGSFSGIKLFDKNGTPTDYSFKNPFAIKKIQVVEDSSEIEIIVENVSEEDKNNLSVKITHIKEFFEKELLDQDIDIWFQGEELLFISPVMPKINEYLFFIIDKSNSEKILTKKIDLHEIEKKE
jgi:hypothetical protein